VISMESAQELLRNHGPVGVVVVAVVLVLLNSEFILRYPRRKNDE